MCTTIMKLYRICSRISTGLLLALSWISGLCGCWVVPGIATVIVAILCYGLMKEEADEYINIFTSFCGVIVFGVLFWMPYMLLYMVPVK